MYVIIMYTLPKTSISSEATKLVVDVADVKLPAAASTAAAKVVVLENSFGLKGPIILNLGSITAILSHDPC